MATAQASNTPIPIPSHPSRFHNHSILPLDMKGSKPGQWGIGPPEHTKYPSAVQEEDENETEFEDDDDPDDPRLISKEAARNSLEDENSDTTTDSNSDDDGETDITPPIDISRTASTPPQSSTDGVNPPQSPTTDDKAQSQGISPRLMAEIMSLVHKEVVPSLVERLQRSPSDNGLEYFQFQPDRTTQYATSVASTSARTEPPFVTYAQPGGQSERPTWGFSPRTTSPTVSQASELASPPPRSSASSANLSSSPASARTSQTLVASDAGNGTGRSIYRPNSSIVVQPPHSTLRSGPSPSSASTYPPSVRFSDRGPPLSPIVPNTHPTPPKPVEFSPIDSKWGTLFSPSGDPTKRLDLVFRGLARYLIEELEPCHTLVVTPSKMLNLYSTHALQAEAIGYSALFRTTAPAANQALAQLYLALGVEYHLVSPHAGTAPTVPALTPAGFSTWLTTNVQAYPEQEALRLRRIFEVWPINCDDTPSGVKLERPERLPKMLSRHLLPREALLAKKGLIEMGVQQYREVIAAGKKRERVTGATLLAEGRSLSLAGIGGAGEMGGGVTGGPGAGVMNGSSARAGRYSDDEQGRRGAVRFEEVEYGGHGHRGESRDRARDRERDRDSRGGDRERERERDERERRTSVALGSRRNSMYSGMAPERRSALRQGSRPSSSSQRRGSWYNRSSEPDVTYGTSPAVERGCGKNSSAVCIAEEPKRRYRGDNRDRERERDRDHERERDNKDRSSTTRDRERDRSTRDKGKDSRGGHERSRGDRDHDRDRGERTREKERRGDRDGEKDGEYRLASSGGGGGWRKRSSMDATPRPDSTSVGRRRSEVTMSSGEMAANADDHGPTWNDLPRALLRAATMDTLAGLTKRDKHRS